MRGIWERVQNYRSGYHSRASHSIPQPGEPSGIGSTLIALQIRTVRPRVGTAVPSMWVLEEWGLEPRPLNSQPSAPCWSWSGLHREATGHRQLTRPRDTGLPWVRMDLDNICKPAFPNGQAVGEVCFPRWGHVGLWIRTALSPRRSWCLPAAIWDAKEKASSVPACLALQVRGLSCPFLSQEMRSKTTQGGKLRMACLKWPALFRKDSLRFCETLGLWDLGNGTWAA